ncbi:alpha/beta hydrolase [Paenibacillus sp. F411]|uniref:alpha/beta hydrolase n=1 Tax=Paenibacillus sp. F411 TaxID=2820239 RepID=UPI001AAE52BC|nr:alpha/beta hydrolase [Paenibacillus sp. F411]MBO2942529.1 alpha/beta hydrolase [Paenibacillus sp. F411]
MPIITLKDMYSSSLHNSRDIFVYLPPSYEKEDDRHYPVLYVHDGQHMFAGDERGDSWDLHLTAEELISQGVMEEIIIVAVSSVTHQRVSEYFHDNPGVKDIFHAECKGEAYEEFLISEVMPRIDRDFRTRTGPEHTALLGSSAGALVSYHIGFHRPDSFGKIGLMSPFLVHTLVNEQGEAGGKPPVSQMNMYRRYEEKPPVSVWLDIGGVEGTFMVSQVRQFADELIELGFQPGKDLMFLVDEAAAHTQSAWRQRAACPLLYFFGDLGQPITLELPGRKEIVLEEKGFHLHPKAQYTSGFQMTLLHARYQAEPPEMLEVKSDGAVIPLQQGAAQVRIHYGGITESFSVEIAAGHTELVEVEVTVTVPTSTIRDDSIHCGFEIPRAEEGLYYGRYLLPRDLYFQVKISKGFGVHEKADSYREFNTCEPRRLHFQVEEWEHEQSSIFGSSAGDYS